MIWKVKEQSLSKKERNSQNPSELNSLKPLLKVQIMLIKPSLPWQMKSNQSLLKQMIPQPPLLEPINPKKLTPILPPKENKNLDVAEFNHLFIYLFICLLFFFKFKKKNKKFLVYSNRIFIYYMLAII